MIRVVLAVECRARLLASAPSRVAERRRDFWRSEFGNASAASEEAVREIEQQTRRTIEEVLGHGMPETAQPAAAEQPQYDGLLENTPLAGKSRLLVDCEHKYDNLEEETISAAGDQPLTDEQLSRIAAIQEAHNAELASLLTPEELIEHNLRFSAAAGVLREHLRGIELAEQEFRDLFSVEQMYETALETLPIDADEITMEGLEAWRQNALRQVLDDERLSGYLLNTLRAAQGHVVGLR